MSVSELAKESVITVQSIDELKPEKVFEVLEKYSFAIVRGLVKPENVRASRKLMEEKFSFEDDNPVTGETPEHVKDHFQKLSIGSARHGGVDRPRFMRVFYNSPWSEDKFNMRDNFKKVAQVRNILMKRPLTFAIEDIEEGLWTASRIHHFPTGGGFMVAHKDTVLPGVLKDQGIDCFFQPVLIMSQKGEDFSTGGGFVQIKGEKYHYEDWCELGDIAIYDTRTIHGVSDIDVDKKMRQDKLTGRFSGLVTLFKDL